MSTSPKLAVNPLLESGIVYKDATNSDAMPSVHPRLTALMQEVSDLARSLTGESEEPRIAVSRTPEMDVWECRVEVAGCVWSRFGVEICEGLEAMALDLAARLAREPAPL